jgi:hypothetical protein
VTPAGIDYGNRHFEAQRLLEQLWRSAPQAARSVADAWPKET